MNLRPKLASWRRQDGYALTVSAAFVSTMLLLIALMVDFGTYAYAKAKMGAAAEAAVLGAVQGQDLVPLPIPRVFVGPVPIDGWLITMITLQNVDFFGGRPTPALLEIAKANAPPGAQNVRISEKTYFPDVSLSPFHYIRYELTADVALPFGHVVSGPIAVSAEACAIAWVPVKHWYHGWWEAAIELPGEHLKFYRIIHCGQRPTSFEGWWDLLDMGSHLVGQFLEDEFAEKTSAPGGKAATGKGRTGKAGTGKTGNFAKPSKKDAKKPKGSAKETAREAQSEAHTGGADPYKDPNGWQDLMNQQVEKCKEEVERSKAEYKTKQAAYEKAKKAWDKATPEERQKMTAPTPPPPPHPDNACDRK